MGSAAAFAPAPLAAKTSALKAVEASVGALRCLLLASLLGQLAGAGVLGAGRARAAALAAAALLGVRGLRGG